MSEPTALDSRRRQHHQRRVILQPPTSELVDGGGEPHAEIVRVAAAMPNSGLDETL